MYYSQFTIEFTRLTQGVGSSAYDTLTAYEPHISHAVDRAIAHMGYMPGYVREIEDDPEGCDRVIVWTSNDRRDTLIAHVTEAATDCVVSWDVCQDCVDAIYGLTDDPSAIDRVARELRSDAERMMRESDPSFAWCDCDSCGGRLGGSRVTFLTLRKGV